MTKQIIPLPPAKTCGIYAITCTANGRVYIGSSTDLRSRLQEHRRKLEIGTHRNPHLVNAVNKYGADSMRYEIVELVADSSQLIDREQWWMDHLDTSNNGFNIRPKAESNVGVKRSAETRARMSAAQKGRTKSEEHRNKMREIFTGRKNGPLSEEHRKKISETLTGRKGCSPSEESRRKMSESRRGRKLPPFTEEHCRKISEAQRGKTRPPFSEEHRRNISEGQRGRKLTEETKQKISEALSGKTGRVHSEETKRKISESNKGKHSGPIGPQSEEHKRKISEALRNRKSVTEQTP